MFLLIILTVIDSPQYFIHATRGTLFRESQSPFVGSFYSLTGEVNYYPHPNVTIRPEVLYDWFTGGRNPYNDGQKDNQVLVAVNAYLQF